MQSRERRRFVRATARAGAKHCSVLGVCCLRQRRVQQSLRDAMRFAVEGFCAEARGRSLTHFAVVGMSAATWQYESRFAAQYDADATALLDAFRAGGVFAGSGAAELPNLELSDSIGHVHPNSSRTVFDASKVWLQKCIALAIPPPLPRVEPLLPPACPAVPATPIAQQHEFFVVFADGASLDVTCTTA